MVSWKKWFQGIGKGAVKGIETLRETGDFAKARQDASDQHDATAHSNEVKGLLANIKLAWKKFTKMVYDKFKKVDQTLDNAIVGVADAHEQRTEAQKKEKREKAAIKRKDEREERASNIMAKPYMTKKPPRREGRQVKALKARRAGSVQSANQRRGKTS